MNIQKFRIDAIIEALDAYGYQSYGLDILKMHEEIERLKAGNERVGPWLSAAMEDPNVCAEMKQDVDAWFKSQEQRQ